MTLRRSIREWDHIPYGEGAAEIPQPHADRIAALARASAFSGRGGEGVLEHGRRGLRARRVVGVIATPGCQLEILPKIERGGEEAPSNAALRARLVHMLAEVHDLPIDAHDMTALGWQRDTLLEILIRLFCRKLSDAVRKGLPRHYIGCQEDLPALRGRLDVARQFCALAATPNRLASRFDALSPDIMLNRIMRAAVTRLARITAAPDNQRALHDLSLAYEGVTALPPRAILWDRITLDRSNEQWRDLITLARMFLAGQYQQTSSGEASGHALMFEMNVLFERYIERLMRRALRGTGLTLSAQGGHRDCLYEGETGRFRTKPDLILRRGEKVMLIADTKWKRMAPKINDPKQGVSQADVYQLMAYARLYECPNVLLLYPHHGGLPPEPICQRYAIAAQNAAEGLIVATHGTGERTGIQVAALKQLVHTVLGSAERQC